MTNKRIILVGINAKYIHSNPAVYSLKTYADTYYGDCSVLDGNSKITDNLTISEYTINQSLDSILADLYNQNLTLLHFPAISGTGAWSGIFLMSFPKSCLKPIYGWVVPRYPLMLISW